MRSTENFTPYVSFALGVTIAILASFQLYIYHEPARIAKDVADQKQLDEFEGNVVFSTYCSVCHGKQGEGVNAPALNNKGFLSSTDDDTIFSVISSGVPGTEMPAWNQVHGGPLTDQQVRQLVVFIRAWEPNAPDLDIQERAGDSSKGLEIFDNICIVCHGQNGMGTDRAPALNDPAKLAQFDDNWYFDTITTGRPAQGMPTWGTVLSPSQVRDLVSLLRAWERGENVQPPD
jgi:cbb3-type cytochrome c oxidase subunit III